MASAESRAGRAVGGGLQRVVAGNERGWDEEAEWSRAPRSTLDALRAVCVLVTGVVPDGLTDGELPSAHLDEAMRRRDEHLAHLVALVRAKAPTRVRDSYCSVAPSRGSMAK